MDPDNPAPPDQSENHNSNEIVNDDLETRVPKRAPNQAARSGTLKMLFYLN